MSSTIEFDENGLPITRNGVAFDDVTLYAHRIFVIVAVTVLCLVGIYSGFISPLLTFFKIRFFSDGFAHRSRIITTAFSALIGFGVLAGLLAITAIKDRNIAQFCYRLWILADYWRNYEQFQTGALLFWYIYGSMAFNAVLNFCFSVFSRWRPLQTEVIQTSERHAFVVVAHNSTRKLAKTIEAILKFAQPHQIYIADNGSTIEERDKTDALCASYSRGESRINVRHISYGNKTLAQYSTIFHLDKCYKEKSQLVDIVTIIDDDVIIPEAFPSKSIEKQFEDTSKIVIAYPLRTENHDGSLCATLQECEYLGGNIARCAQDLFGNQLFASGAIATWKVAQLKSTLERHCTAFNGEDLEMGYILHRLCSESSEKLGVAGPVRIGLARDCVVPTSVPSCFMHYYDWLPYPLKRRLNISPCSCGEHSLFNQRLRSWDPANHQFFFKFCKIIFSPRGGMYSPKLFIRILCLWKLISNIREYMLIIGVLMSFIQLRSLDNLLALAVFYADSIVVSWALGVICTLCHSANLRQQGLAIRPDIAFCYPIMFELVYALVIKPLSCIYSITYYIFFQRFPNDIRDQLAKNPDMKKTLEGAWENEIV